MATNVITILPIGNLIENRNFANREFTSNGSYVGRLNQNNF